MVALRNINFWVIAVVVIVLLYLLMNYGSRISSSLSDLTNSTFYSSQDYPNGSAMVGRGSNGMQYPQAANEELSDMPNPDVYGTTATADARWNNQTVRPEFNKDPFPLAYGECTSCVAKKGCADPSPGFSHGCKCGLPSKRVIDANGSNFQLPHMCAPCQGDVTEPSQLGRWWKRKGCSNPESVGLDMRPSCSRC